MMKMTKINLFVRSSLFSLGLIISLLIFTPLTLPFKLILPYPRYYYLMSNWGKFVIWWLKITCRIHYKIHGVENIPKQTVVVLCKHQSAWETFALQVFFPMQAWVLKRELLWIPFFGWALASMKPIAIDRDQPRKALQKLIKLGQQRLAQNIWVVIFPEGTRVAPGEKKPYAVSGALLATKANYPVLPVAHNAGNFWPKRGFIKYPGTIQVSIGQLIDIHDKKVNEINKIAETWIENEIVHFDQQNFTPH